MGLVECGKDLVLTVGAEWPWEGSVKGRMSSDSLPSCCEEHRPKRVGWGWRSWFGGVMVPESKWKQLLTGWWVSVGYREGRSGGRAKFGLFLYSDKIHKMLI
jgi:hypothetical protein